MGTGRTFSADKLYAKINHTATTGVVGETEYETLGEIKISVATTFATSGTLTVQGRIKNSTSWQTIGTLTSGGDFDSFDVDVYDYIRFNFTVAAGSTGEIACSGFFKASAAAGGSSFTTMQTPAGTSPVADSASDTLTFASADASVTITGNSTTDTIDLSASGGASALDDLSDAIYTGETVAIGNGAGAADDGSANHNVFIGKDAGTSVTTGSGIVAIGHGAYDANLTGASAVVIGYNAGQKATSAGNSVLIGADAGFNNTGGFHNTQIGFAAGYNGTTGSGNTMVGYQAGRGINQGVRARNVMIGYQAGNGMSTAASDNIVIGYDIEPVSATADDQLNIGNTIYGDIINGYVGINNTAPDVALDVTGDVDFGGLISQTGTGDSVMLGEGAGVADDLSANQNVYIGKNAGNVATTATKQVAIGYQAGLALTTSASANVFVGHDAGKAMTNSGECVYIGPNAGSLATGANGTGIGADALKNLTSAQHNTALGNNASFWTTGAANTVIGADAGFGVGTGINNTLLGYRAGYNLSNSSRNIVIGENADAAVAGNSDQLSIGNVIYGDLSAENIGVGLTAPTATLHLDQSSASGAKPVLRLDQGDIDDSFIDFIGTSAADGTRSISSDTTEDSAKFGAIRVEINGTTKWIRIYDDES